MKPKVWLHKNGHIEKISRGRLSREHIAIIEEAVANGAVIEGYSVSKAKLETDKPQVEKAIVRDPNRLVDVPDPARDESSFEAYVFEDGKRKVIGKRTVCNLCGSSLTYCHCEKPMVWVDFERQSVVHFKPLH